MGQRGCQSVGIDLGTTYSSLAYMDAQMLPRVVADSSGQVVVPSVVYFDDEEIIVGDIALQQARLNADRVVQFIKVHMGDEWRKQIDGHLHTPESISAIILRHLIRESEPQIGPITTAVITVPAYFTEKRRRATQQAGEIAGLQVIGTLNEPMAAALAYGLHREDKEQLALVYDLGGGTFDVTIVRIAPNELEELAIAGNRRLGGKDWDQCLFDFVADDFLKRHKVDPRSSPQAVQDLQLECEKAKRRLGRMARTSIRLQVAGCEHVVGLTSEKFESLTAHLLQATRLTTELALEDAGLKWNQIARILLVGGSTHMPAVRRMLKQISCIVPTTSVNPVIAVALGAATYAHMRETGKPPKTIHQQDLTQPACDVRALPVDSDGPETSGPPATPLPHVRFVTAHGVGVKARLKEDWINAVLIPKNTRVPCRVTKRFYSIKSRDGGNSVKIQVTQGDTTNLDLAEPLGTGRIRGLPQQDPTGQPVDITMEFDDQGRLHIQAVYVNTKKSLRLSLEIPGGLHEEAVQQHRQFMKQSSLAAHLFPVDPDGEPLRL